MDADIEAGAVISTFTVGDESKSWVRTGDTGASVYPGDPRSYAWSTMEKYMKE